MVVAAQKHDLDCEHYYMYAGTWLCMFITPHISF